MTTLTENISVLRAHLSTAEKELNLLQSGRKASSARARKSLQNIKQLSHSLRKEIVEHVKSIPTKKRAPSKDVAPEPAITVAAVAKPAKKIVAAAKPATEEQPPKKTAVSKKNKEKPVPER